MPMYSYLFENLLFWGGKQRKHGVYSILYKYMCVELVFFFLDFEPVFSF